MKSKPETIAIDVTESPIEHPKKQRKYYSGKKKRHTIKSRLIAKPKTKLVLSVEQANGCVHDFKLYKNRTDSAVSPDVKIKTDSGYQGITTYHAKSEVPYKKSKNRPLTPEEKAFNRRLARDRIVIEHINREIKVFKIMAERCRNRRKLRMTLICAIRNYEIIKNKS